MHRLFGATLVGALALTTAACDGGARAVASRDYDPPEASRVSTRAVERVRLADRDVEWAANKAHTAAENARYQFDKNGADFGARSVKDYVAKANAFVADPPSGADSITRPNGDRLIYDAKANTFAVVSRDGQPRTLFKPKDGPAYWKAQKAKADQQAAKSASTRDG